MDITTITGAFFIGCASLALLIGALIKGWLFASDTYDRITRNFAVDARKQLGADIGVSANWIRGDEDRQMMVKALQTLLEGGFDVRGGQWRAEYERLHMDGKRNSGALKPE